MGNPAATQTSPVLAVDLHIVMVPTPVGPVPVPLPHPFSGQIVSGTVSTVLTGGLPTATVNSTAQNLPPHLPTPPGVMFQKPPSNQGTVLLGSMTVMAGGQGVARLGDKVMTCNDPADLPQGTIINGAPTVLVG